MRTAVTIAGSDSSGGAGIQADIKTMIANGVYAMSAITALTAQNTTGVTGIMEVTPEFLGEELDNIFTDIYPDAVKIGMVSSSALIEKIADKLKEYQAKNIVVDPVMVATSGAKLISEEAIGTLKKRLLPIARQVPEMHRQLLPHRMLQPALPHRLLMLQYAVRKYPVSDLSVFHIYFLHHGVRSGLPHAVSREIHKRLLHRSGLLLHL